MTPINAICASIAAIGFALAFVIACSAPARAQQEIVDIGHRDFGETTCYYATSARTGDVTALSCVK